LLQIHPEVADALSAGRPVVALESTILAHGLPRGDNRRVADEIEQQVRAGGSVPATIAVLDGAVRVGLDPGQLDRLCCSDDIAKLSVRDLGPALALGVDGATTVASTSALAHRAGIAVFATGGLGGVHRGAGAELLWSPDNPQSVQWSPDNPQSVQSPSTNLPPTHQPEVARPPGTSARSG